MGKSYIIIFNSTRKRLLNKIGVLIGELKISVVMVLIVLKWNNKRGFEVIVNFFNQIYKHFIVSHWISLDKYCKSINKKLTIRLKLRLIRTRLST